MREGLHPHGGWAPISAAVAVGRLREFDADTMAQGIRIAVTPFIVGHWRAALEGASIRNFYTGLACQHGLMAAELAGSGVTGINGAIEECLLPYTTANEVTADLLAPFETFGSEYYLTSSYFKIHAACRYTHAPIEALAVIHERVNFNPGDVKRIQVRTFERGALLDRTDPDTVLAAKFSTPFALATRIQTGRSDAEAFTPDRVGDPAIQALAERVKIIPDEEFEARAVDGQWGAHVVVELTDGTRHAETVQDARGGGNAPFTREVVYEKFDALVDTQLPSDQRTTLRRRLLNIECGDNVGTLLEPLRVDTQ
jgi:2-methylcitrate dehydratase PrpD